MKSLLAVIAAKQFSLLTLVAMPLFTVAYADDDKPDGAVLHSENCIACHSRMTDGDGSLLYTRNDHRVTSLTSLEAQVRRCESNIGLTWFDDQIFAVRDYLNETYYQFSQ